MASEFPEITYKSPLSILGVVNATRPDIIIDWSVDVDTTQFSTAESRAGLVMLINESTNTIVDTEYVSYDSTRRRLTLRPSSDLPRNTLFSVLIDNRVLATTGRRSKLQYRWQFTTDVGTLDTTQLLDPADYSVHSTFPTFSWTPAGTGLINYYFQVDDRFDFSSPLYSTTTTATSINPIASYTDNTTYYWRVFGYTATTSGAWSDIRAFFYGTPRAAHASTKQEWYEADEFGIARLGWVNGASNQSAFPTISLTFSSIPDSNFLTSTYIGVYKKNIMPRNDQVSTYLETAVAGSWTLSGSTLTFTPGEAIENNTRYEVRVSKYLPNTDGTELGKDYTYYFTGHYSPRYADIPEVRRLFLSAEHNIPDDMINYYLFFASLEANARYYGNLQGVNYQLLGDALKEPVVRDTTDLNSFSVGRWVAAKAVYDLLKAILIEMTRQVDSSRKLGDYEYSLGPGFIKAMDMALKLAAEDLEKWDSLLTPNDLIRGTSKSARWDPRERDFDWSIMNLEARRDDAF